MTKKTEVTVANPTTVAVPEYLLGLKSNIQPQAAAIAQLSIRGKFFRIVKDGQEMPLVEQTATGDTIPLQVLEVVVYAQSDPRSRVYYASDFSGDASAPPDCFSLDGERPDAMAIAPQASVCSKCPQAKKGSRRTKSGYLSTACVAQQRLVVAPVTALRDVCLLRLPATSLFDRETAGRPWQAWRQYNATLASLNIPSTAAVVTALRFDVVDYPKLVFKMQRYITPEEYPIVKEMSESPDVLRFVLPTVTSDEPSVTPSSPESSESSVTPPSSASSGGLSILAALMDE